MTSTPSPNKKVTKTEESKENSEEEVDENGLTESAKAYAEFFTKSLVFDEAVEPIKKLKRCHICYKKWTDDEKMKIHCDCMH